MEKIVKKYVEIMRGGVLYPEYDEEEVEEVDPLKIELKEGQIGFKFFEAYSIMDEGVEYEGPTKDLTGWYYDGKRLSFDDVLKRYEKDPDRYDILVRNMRGNQIDSVCETRYGTFRPLEDGDMTIEEYRESLEMKNAGTIKVKSKTNSKNN
jgi:hypothetical protein